MAELRYNDDGTLDEVCSKHADNAHLEQLDDDCWCLNLDDTDGDTLLYLYAKPTQHKYWWRKILARIFGWIVGPPVCHANVLEVNQKNKNGLYGRCEALRVVINEYLRNSGYIEIVKDIVIERSVFAFKDDATNIIIKIFPEGSVSIKSILSKIICKNKEHAAWFAMAGYNIVFKT